MAERLSIGLSTFQNLGGTIFGRKYLVNRRAARRRKHAKANGKYAQTHAETCENPQKTRENAFIYWLLVGYHLINLIGLIN